MRKLLPFLLISLFFFGCKDQVSGGEKDDTIVVDTPLVPTPKIEKVDSLQESGEYNAGEDFKIRVYFGKVVKVTGTPRLLLDFGSGLTRHANYVNGNNSSVLTFSYEVQPGEFTEKLKVRIIDLNSGSIKTDEGKEVSLTLPKEGESGNFEALRSLKVGLSDNFNDNKFSTQWSFNDSDNYDMDQNGSEDDDISTSFFESSSSGDGRLTLNGRGRDVWKKRKEFTSLYLKNQTGDFDFSIKVTGRSTAHWWTKSGLMLANDHTDLSQSGIAFCSTTQNNAIAMQWDSNGDGKVNRSVHREGSSSLPVWIRLKKTDNKVQCFYKYSENAAWTTHSAGEITIVSGSGSFDVGVFSTSHNRFANLTVQFDDFKSHK